MKKKLYYLAGLFLFLVCTELFLRFYFGFCDTVLIKEDPDYEYIAQPNQNRFRFRHHIRYNSLSMRSEEVDTAARLILGLGDSVINGGALTDQDSLATTILSDSLSKRQGSKVQFLNISAGSWGPDNCYAYLKKHGHYNADAIYLFVSSHDAYDNMTFEKTVDANVNFPSKQYSLAFYELFDRYLIPRLKEKFGSASPPADQNLGINKQVVSTPFNPGFNALATYSAEKKIPLIIYLHAEKGELLAKKYNRQGEKIIQFANDNNIPIIKDLENRLEETDFRDDIHINAKGQKNLAANVLSYMGRSKE